MIEHYRKLHGGSSSRANSVPSAGDPADPGDPAKTPPESTMAEDTESLAVTCSAPSPSDNIPGTLPQGGLRQQLQAELRKLQREKLSINAKLDKNIEAVLTILASVKEVQDPPGV